MSTTDREVPTVPMTVEDGTVALLNKSEIDQQIATAHRYPRSIKHFRDEAMAMVTLTDAIAQECIYALPRDGKVIEGPSARFAEIAASAWGNCRAGARVVNEGPEFVTAQGVFHDLERNVAITYEVQRRIVDKYNKRYKPDMIGVTANAACSIALRNAILKGIPKAFWADMYAAARATVAGDVKTLANRRADALKAFQVYGVTETQILRLLHREGLHDVGLDDLVVLRGILTALRDGDTTPEQAFGDELPNVQMPQPKHEAVVEAAPTSAPAPSEPPPTALKPMTAGQRRILEGKLKEAQIAEDVFTFEVGPWSDLAFADFQRAMAWIKDRAGAE
ncbi:MAG: hypothetical protein KGL39_42975 [Patescibacteria group bacterium]|nr:hypothetical protein [Patescibacteria group bacterium]